MNNCSHCSANAWVKAGSNPSGSQRFQCKACRQYWTPQPTAHGYDEAKRAQALALYLEGNGLRRIGRLLKTHHQTIANWITQHHAQLPAAPPQPASSEVTELDELYTFSGAKKTGFTL
jgi:transposase-like protein